MEWTGKWGLRARSIDVRRRDPDGGDGFLLDVPNLDVEVTAGSNRLPIMGPSGAGKSTLMNVLAGNLRPGGPDSSIVWHFADGWQVQWSGDGLSSSDALMVRRRYFGFAFQHAQMLPHLTVGENLIASRMLMKNEARGQAADYARQLMSDVIPDVQWDSISRRYFADLSGGQKQRAALALSMVHEPRVLFADEPTGSLDLDTRNLVMGVLIRWLDDDPEGRLLIWVTHHDDDPMRFGAGKRLFVSGGSSRYEVVSPQAGPGGAT